LAIDFWPSLLVKILKKVEDFVPKKKVFWLFQLYIGILGKCHIYSFIEQVKLYRLVYDSIWTVRKLKEKFSNINMVLYLKKVKYDVRGHFSGLIISAPDHFETESYLWFDAELDGLQNDTKYFLGIDFWPSDLVKILKKVGNFLVKKKSILTFSITYWGPGKMSYIQFCRASEALSNGIWLNLKSEKFSRKNAQTKISRFLTFFRKFLRVSQIHPLWRINSKCLDLSILDSSMI
jgi:hypothetical protein